MYYFDGENWFWWIFKRRFDVIRLRGGGGGGGGGESTVEENMAL